MVVTIPKGIINVVRVLPPHDISFSNLLKYIMCDASTLRFSLTRGFGETHWVVCPVCWNSMKSTHWEDGSEEELCGCCERIALTMDAIDGSTKKAA